MVQYLKILRRILKYFLCILWGLAPPSIFWNPNSTSRIYQNFSPGLAFGPVDENMTSVYMGI